MMDDHELLHAYANDGSDDAFAELVRRHLNLVYSAALRQVGDAALAEEVCQTVFLVLADKGPRLSKTVIIPGWLVLTTRFASANVLRGERRRQRVEVELMNSIGVESAPAPDREWAQASPEIDEALAGLSARYRDAIVLRFFEKRTLDEVGRALGVSPDTAQKRVARGLAKLRGLMTRKGVSISAGTLGTLLMANAVAGAPPVVGSAVVSAVSRMGLAVAGTGVPGTLQLMALRHIRALVVPGVAILAVILGALVILAPRSAPLPQLSGVARSNLARPMVSALVVSSANALLPAAVGAEAFSGDVFQFRVLDAAGDAPVSNARLTLTQVQLTGRTTNVFSTDTQGTALLPRPDRREEWNYRIEVFRDGYVPKYVSWAASQGDALDQFPAAYSTRLDRGTVIGGQVVDEQGQPIAGVRLSFDGTAPGGSRERERLTMMGNYHFEMTDDTGRWKCDHVPTGFERITWRLTHPRFQPINYGVDTAGDNTVGLVRFAKEKLIASAAVMPMKAGLTVRGVVLDDSGQPLSGARVRLGREIFRTDGDMLTDADGSFEFRNARPKQTILSVETTGWAPQEHGLTPTENTEEQRFALNRGVVIRGRVVSEAGAAISNATVRLATDEVNQFAFDWRARTDVDGRFGWTNAPIGRSYAVNATGYESASSFAMSTNGTEDVIRLKSSETRKRLTVTVSAVDAITAEPLRGFGVKAAQSQGIRIISSNSYTFGMSTPERVASAVLGTTTVVISSYTKDFFLEASAPGYLPSRMTNANRGQGTMSMEFKLLPGKAVTGVVEAADGQPVSRAEVFLRAVSDIPNSFAERTVRAPHPLAPYARTGNDGRFTFDPQVGMTTVVAAHESGYAEVPVGELEGSQAIRLRPWTQVNGVFKIRGLPKGGQKLSLSGLFGRDRTVVAVSRTTRTDAQGRFEFGGLPPGEYHVVYNPGVPHRMPGPVAMSHDAIVVTRAGETNRVEIGGTGARVIGHVVPDGISDPIDWLNDAHRMYLKVVGMPDVVGPDRAKFSSDLAFVEALMAFTETMRQFWDSDAGVAFKRAQRQYALRFDPDGRFEVTDVPAGTYELTIAPTAMNQSGTSSHFSTSRIGLLRQTVVIPEVAGDETPSIDLGKLKLKPGE